MIRLHSIIMNTIGTEDIVDHRDWDKSNNRKLNLRICNKSFNNVNIKRKSNNTTGYTGVKYNKRQDRYIAQISYDNKRIHLGTFLTKEEAIKVRHDAEIKYHGEFSGEINRNDYYNLIR